MSTAQAGQLVRRCAHERDEESWKEFERLFRSKLLLAIRLTKQKLGRSLQVGDDEDLLQDVYCRLLSRDGINLTRCRADDAPQVVAYLQRIARSVVLDRGKAAAAEKRGAYQVVDFPAECEADLAELAVEGRPDPESELIARERKQLFFARCREFVGPKNPRRDLLVLYLAFFEGMTSREIVERLGSGTTVTGIDSLIYRVRGRLRAIGVPVPRRA